MDALTTYREDARDKEVVLLTLEEIAKHKHIRFSGRDKDLSEQHWCLAVNLYLMDHRNLDTPTAWRTYKVLYDVFQKIDAEVKEIKKDAESIDQILSGHGYELQTISNDVNTASLYVRHRMHSVDVLTDRDPYTRRWKLGYHEVAREDFPEWCERALDSDNTMYRRMKDWTYRVRKSIGDSIIGMAVGAWLASIPTTALTLAGDPMLGQGIMFTAIGISGIGAIVKSYRKTRTEPQLTLDRARVKDGKKALSYAIDESKLK